MRKKGFVILGMVILVGNLCWYLLTLAQEGAESTPCPKPYIKLIKPNVANAGQQIIIRGHRFGEEEPGGEVIFTPGIKGKVISWNNSRITVEVPSRAKTGEVVIRNKCAISNGEFFKIGE
jgi:hypothetical protein